MNSLQNLEPKALWYYFNEICQVPRPSKHEGKIIEYLIDFSISNNLEAKKDFAGNILIKKPATNGFEDHKTVILQSHMDMVCEKNDDVTHDFLNDPIIPIIENGWIKAQDTTLGADCGIGMAASLAILADHDISHPELEVLFTVDEETGLTGAKALQSGFMHGKILLNLDSEDEGELFIGCAGGIDSIGSLKFSKEDISDRYFPMKITVSGLQGGHSGDDIEKGRGNSIKILNRFLYQLNSLCEYRLHTLQGGNLRNAIPREAYAIILVQSDKKELVAAELNCYRAELENELYQKEPKFKMCIESCEKPEFVIDKSTQNVLLPLLYSIPHGVYSLSHRMPGMVETSTNLASIKFKENSIIEIVTSQRSDLESGKVDIKQMVAATFRQAGAEVKHGEGYCGWAPNPSSQILDIARSCYESLFKVKPVVRSIHAGLECGLFLEKFPDLDMISFGPTLRGVHSPDEKLEVASVEKFWIFLTQLLTQLP